MSKFLLEAWDGVVAEGVVNEDDTITVTPTSADVDGTVTYDSMADVLVDYTDATVLEEN